MKISIVLPVYNDTRVGRALDSILAQQHDAELELIVVDGGSTDGTLDILEEYRPHLTTLVSERDNGIYDAMNKGVARATGDIVGILNADDRYHDAKVLHDVLEVFQLGSVDAVYGDLVYVDGDRIVRYWESGRARRAKYYLGWIPPHPAFFLHRSVYEQFGLFNNQLRVVGDYEFMLRVLVRHRVKVAYLPRVLVRMAVGGTSSGSIGAILRNNIEVLRSWRINGLRWGYLVPVLKPAQKAVQFTLRPPRIRGLLDPFP